MPKRKQTPARPRDMNELAVHIGKIATHQIEDAPPLSDRAAVARGEARRDALSKSRRSEIAKKAAKARWSKE